MSDFWTDIGGLATESQVNTVACELFPITNRRVLSVQGVDSAKFMQGQFTCDINEITTSQYRHGACCNAKGRMVANFTLVKQGDDYLLALDTDAANALQAHLKKYMVFFKSDLNPTDYVMAGLKGPHAKDVLTKVFGGAPNEKHDYAQFSFEGGIVTQLPFQAGYEIWLSPEHANECIQTLLAHCSLSGSEQWLGNLIQHGLPLLTQASVETQIPQMINLAQIGGISFSKGCYTGQEIVARMQYLGKLKRHLYQISIQSGSIDSEDSLYTPDSKSPVGTIINAVKQGEASLALAVIEDKHLQNPLFADSDLGTAVELLSLPYNPQEDPQNTGS